MKTSSDVERDHPSYLNDESGLVTDGSADKIFFPRTEEELRSLVQEANVSEKPITISGGGTGISGGRVPLSGWILATDDMVSIVSHNEDDWNSWKDHTTGKIFEYYLEEITGEKALLTVPVSMTVKSIQDLCRSINWFYPPDPTERSCFIGGNIATNASGARSFKYGPTRNWVQSVRVILPNGDLAVLSRDDHPIGNSRTFEIQAEDGIYTVPRPTYPLSHSTKDVAGLVITDDSQPIDLFIGNEGLMGVVTEVTLKLIRPPDTILNIFVYLSSKQQAIELAKVAQSNRANGDGPVPMSVEYLDDRAISIISQEEEVPKSSQSLIILEQDASSEEELYDHISYWMKQFEKIGVDHTSVAQDHKEIEHHKSLRHLVPETINETARGNGQPKLGTDYAAPLHLMEEMLDLAGELGEQFEQEVYPKGRPHLKFAYAIWSHFGDNHIHLNFLPRTDEQRELAKKLMVEYMMQIVTWKGSIAAEHGLGKKTFDGEPALKIQLGQDGLQQIYEIKKSLDPHMLLNKGNLLGMDLSSYS